MHPHYVSHFIIIVLYSLKTGHVHYYDQPRPPITSIS